MKAWGTSLHTLRRYISWANVVHLRSQASGDHNNNIYKMLPTVTARPEVAKNPFTGLARTQITDLDVSRGHVFLSDWGWCRWPSPDSWGATTSSRSLGWCSLAHAPLCSPQLDLESYEALLGLRYKFLEGFTPHPACTGEPPPTGYHELWDHSSSSLAEAPCMTYSLHHCISPWDPWPYLWSPHDIYNTERNWGAT